MTPDKLAKSGTEHAHQVALFAYCAVANLHGFEVADAWCKHGDLQKAKDEETEYPVNALEWLHAIPNGGSRGDDAKSRKIRGGQLKAEGVRQGVADVFLPWPITVQREYDECGNPAKYTEVLWHGLYIEMKKPSERPKREGSKGGMSNDQIAFKKYAVKVGYGFMTCYSWDHAVSILKAYIEYNARAIE